MFDSKELSWKDMFLFVFLKWRIILVVMLVFAVLLPYVAARRGGSILPENSGEEEQKEPESVDVTLANIRTVSGYYKDYDNTEQKIKQNKDLGVDPNGYNAVYVQYHIAVDSEENKANIAPILTTYKLYFTGTEFVDGLLQTAGTGIDPVLYKQFIVVGVENSDFIIKVPLRDEMDPEGLTQKVKDLTEAEFKRVQPLFAHRLEAVSEGVSSEKNDAIAKEQKALVSSNTELNKSIKAVIKEMTEEQTQYARDLADGKTTEEELKELLASKDKEEEEKAKGSGMSPVSTLAFALAGALVGMLFIVFILCETYILSGKLHTTRELSKNAGLFIAGTIDIPAKNRQGGIDSRIRSFFRDNKRQFDIDHQIDIAASSVSLLCKRNEIDSILLTSSMYGMIDEDVTGRLVSAISSQGIDTSYVDNIVFNKDALLECSKNGNILLVEQIGRSTLSEVENEILAANGYGIRISGVIVVS